jgi:hypothetical protein
MDGWAMIDSDVPCVSAAMRRESSPAGELLCLSSGPICCAGGGGTRISPEPPPSVRPLDSQKVSPDDDSAEKNRLTAGGSRVTTDSAARKEPGAEP